MAHPFDHIHPSGLTPLQIYVTDIVLSDDGREDVTICAHSYVNAVHTELYGGRIFFAVRALIPPNCR